MVYVIIFFPNPEQGVSITALIAEKVPITISAEYLDFKDMFSKKSAIVLPKHSEINTYAIDLGEGK